MSRSEGGGGGLGPRSEAAHGGAPEGRVLRAEPGPKLQGHGLAAESRSDVDSACRHAFVGILSGITRQ